MLRDTKKENLVIAEILNKNYNPQMFYSYLQSNTIRGSDLGKWTLSELQAEVERYKCTISGDDDPLVRNTTNLDRYKHTSNPDAQEDEEFIDLKLNMRTEDEKDKSQVYELITHNKILVNEFFKTENVEIEIYNSTEQTSYWFMKEVYFMIQVSPMNWKVNRTFNDFILLKDSLKKTYPFTLVGLLGA